MRQLQELCQRLDVKTTEVHCGNNFETIIAECQNEIYQVIQSVVHNKTNPAVSQQSGGGIEVYQLENGDSLAVAFVGQNVTLHISTFKVHQI